MIQDTIRTNFERIRAEKGIKIDDLAAALGVRRQQVHKYSYGGTVASLEKLAAALGVEPYELLKPAADQDEAAQDPGADSVQTICPHCGKPLQIIVK